MAKKKKPHEEEALIEAALEDPKEYPIQHQGPGEEKIHGSDFENHQKFDKFKGDKK
jgi:hypothetical protein